MSRTTNGWQAEKFVLGELLEFRTSHLIAPLSPSYPADIVTASNFELWEVKSSRNRAQALRTKLTAAEEAERVKLGDRYHVVRVQTFPDGSCKLLEGL